MTNKAREALQAVVDCEFDGRLQITETAFEKVLDALKEPLRNCDVGTAEEQAERFGEFCAEHINSSRACFGCPLFSSITCCIGWEHLPYESEVDNETTKA